MFMFIGFFLPDLSKCQRVGADIRGQQWLSISDLFFRRFREEISFPRVVERSALKLPLYKLCVVPLAVQNRALFEGEKREKRCPEKGRKRGGQQRGQKGKRTRENRLDIEKGGERERERESTLHALLALMSFTHCILDKLGRINARASHGTVTRICSTSGPSTSGSSKATNS